MEVFHRVQVCVVQGRFQWWYKLFTECSIPFGRPGDFFVFSWFSASSVFSFVMGGVKRLFSFPQLLVNLICQEKLWFGLCQQEEADYKSLRNSLWTYFQSLLVHYLSDLDSHPFSYELSCPPAVFVYSFCQQFSFSRPDLMIWLF